MTKRFFSSFAEWKREMDGNGEAHHDHPQNVAKRRHEVLD